MKFYLAGPDVFRPDAIEIGQQKKQICENFGLEGCFPLDNVVSLPKEPVAAGLEIYRQNLSLMRSCEGVIANLTPFRGPSADVGTAFELGFFVGEGKPVYGYSCSAQHYADRVVGAVDGRDADGNEVEQFMMADNLMLAGALMETGVGMVTPHELADASGAQGLALELMLFEALVRRLVE